MSDEVNDHLDEDRPTNPKAGFDSTDNCCQPPQLAQHAQIPIWENVLSTYPGTPSVWQSPQSTQEELEKKAKSKTYGAPRVFDLFTLLAITLAFALLFALLGILAPALDISARELTVIIGVYVSLVGFSQMWLFGSNNPRLASLISGPFAFILVCWMPLSHLTDSMFEALTASVCFAVLFGPMAGYIAGAVVAGVFLLADKFRLLRTEPNSTPPKDASFDEVR